jgi:hypothetical protein
MLSDWQRFRISYYASTFALRRVSDLLCGIFVVLCDSVVRETAQDFTTEGTENAEIAQRQSLRLRTFR